jgi:hypothetical protein
MGRMKSSQIAPVSGLTIDHFPALQDQPINNLAAGETLSLSDLMRVKIPTGGIIQWVIDAVDGQQVLPKLEGVILAQALIRTLYGKPFEETGGMEPPICFSANSLTAKWNRSMPYPDNLHQFGVPTENCLQCPLAQWGTRPKNGNNANGRGMACQQRRIFLLMTLESQMPLLVTIPTSGLKVAKQYLIGLQALGLEHWQVLTSISLIEAKNADGIKYAKPQFLLLEKLPATVVQAVKRYKQTLEQQISTLQFAASYPVLTADAANSESVNAKD